MSRSQSVSPFGAGLPQEMGTMSVVVEPMSIKQLFPEGASEPASRANACQFDAATSSG